MWNNCLFVYCVKVWAIMLPIVGVQVSPHILIPKNNQTTPQGIGGRRGRTARQRANISGLHWGHMSYSLNSSRGVYGGLYRKYYRRYTMAYTGEAVGGARLSGMTLEP